MQNAADLKPVKKIDVLALLLKILWIYQTLNPFK